MVPMRAYFHTSSHLALPVVFACLFAFSELSAKELGAYRVGDKLEADIVATERMTVIDPEATGALKDKEAEKIPVICRFYPGAVDEAEAALRKAFSDARSNFLNSVELKFKQRTLDAEATASVEFRQLVGAFQSRNTGFPLSTDLAARWARGESDGGLEDTVMVRLRETMKRPIRPYGLPDGLKLTYSVRLIALADRNAMPLPEIIEREGRNVARTNLITLRWAQSRLQGIFPEAEQSWGKFTASFVIENCFPDAQLTRQARAKRTDLLQVADTYETDQVIARRGDVVDAKIVAAISRLVEQTAAKQLQQNLAENTAQTAVVQERNRWLVIALIGSSLVAVTVIWMIRRQPSASLLPARAVDEYGAVVVSNDWRSSFAPHLMRLLSGKLFQRLLSQRKQMIATQEKAANEMAELEAQLEKLRAPLEERLRAYESRIADLEKELATRGEENEALLKAKIGMVRKQLETARRGQIELN
jgi:7TM-HD extracellular